MSRVTFDGAAHTLTIGSQTFTAFNNVDSKSNGKWPNGTYEYSAVAEHNDDQYGAHGNVIFSVPARTGMGVHSGRSATADGLGRVGPAHATMGCIRTTDAGVQALRALAGRGLTLEVKNN